MARARGRETFGDMARTAVIFGVIIVGIVAFLPKSHHSPSTQRVDYSAELDIARHRAPFHVLAPQGLPSYWIATHVTIAVPQNGSTVSTFDLGFYVQKPDAYAQVEQSDAPGWRAKQLGATARQTGTTTVAGVAYELWRDSSGQPALVRATSDGSTLVLNGKASPAVLTELAAALH